MARSLGTEERDLGGVSDAPLAFATGEKPFFSGFLKHKIKAKFLEKILVKKRGDGKIVPKGTEGSSKKIFG